MIRQLALAIALLVTAAACSATGATGPGESSPPLSHTGTQPGSTGINVTEATKVAPLAPPTLTAITEAGAVRLNWPATGEDVAHYQCLRRAATTDRWENLAQASDRDRTCLDKVPSVGTYVYGVQAVNSLGTASAITESQPITIPA